MVICWDAAKDWAWDGLGMPVPMKMEENGHPYPLGCHDHEWYTEHHHGGCLDHIRRILVALAAEPDDEMHLQIGDMIRVPPEIVLRQWHSGVPTLGDYERRQRRPENFSAGDPQHKSRQCNLHLL